MIKAMPEGCYHKSLKEIVAELLEGETECPAGGRRRADACNSKAAVEVECSKKGCEILFYRQPYVKDNRTEPLLKISLSDKEVGELLQKLGISCSCEG